MGAWGSAAWDNDLAADWFGELFGATKLARRVEKTLKHSDIEEYAPEIRAAAYMLVALGRNYVWPVEDFDRHLRLAISKLEVIRGLADYEGEPSINAEIAILRSRLEDPHSLGTKSSDEEEQRKAAEALRNLSDPSAAVRLKAAKWLSKQASAAPPHVGESWLGTTATTAPLVAALRDPDPQVAEEAILAIGEIARRYFRDDNAYPGVVRLLRSKRPLTRARAAQAAAALRGERCLDDVLPLLRSRDAPVRQKVLLALATFAEWAMAAERRERMLEAVRPLLKDRDATVRGSAARLLGMAGNRTLLPKLKQALKAEKDDLGREALERAVERIEQMP
jgi:HEAT repeat protein